MNKKVVAAIVALLLISVIFVAVIVRNSSEKDKENNGIVHDSNGGVNNNDITVNTTNTNTTNNTYNSEDMILFPKDFIGEADEDFSSTIFNRLVTPKLINDVMEGQNLKATYPVHLDKYKITYARDNTTFSLNLVDGGAVFYSDMDTLSDPYLYYGSLQYTITSESGTETVGEIKNALLRSGEKLEVTYEGGAIAFDLSIFEKDELKKVNCSVDSVGQLATYYYPRIYEYAVEEYIESEVDEFNKRLFYRTLNKIQDNKSLTMVKPSANGYQSEYMNFKQLQTKADPTKEYTYAVEKSANEIYMVQVLEDKTIIDIYAIDYVKPYSTCEYSLSLEGQIVYDYELKNLITSINTLGLLHYDKNNNFVIDITDRDLNIIETIILPKSINIVNMMYDYKSNDLMYVFTVIEDPTGHGSENVKQVAMRCSYKNYKGLHFVYDMESHPVGNGKLIDSMWFYAPNGPYDFTTNAGYQVISTNEAAVIEFIKEENNQIYPRIYLNEYVLLLDAKESIVEVRKYNRKVENSPIYDLNIYRLHIQADRFGNIYYLEDKSFDLVKLDEEFHEVTRYTDLDDEIVSLLKAAKEYVNWSIDGNYLVVSDMEQRIYSMNLENLAINDYDFEGSYIQFVNYRAVSNYGSNKYEYYDVDLNEFVSVYTHHKETYYNESYFEYEDVAYYESDPEINYGAEPSIEERKDILPESMAPQFTWLGEAVEVLESKKYKDISYYKLINGFVGLIFDEEFTPLIEEDVRDYVVNDGDIFYIGYEENSNVIKCNSDQVVTSLTEKYAIDSITVFNGYVYYTTNNTELKRVSLSSLKSGTAKGKTVASLQQLAGKINMSAYDNQYCFEVDSTQDYLVAFDSLNHKTLVFNKDGSMREVINSSFKYLTEDNFIITGILSFIARHDIKSGTDILIDEKYFFYPDMRFGDLLLSCTPYEGPSWIESLDIYGDEINKFKDYDNYSEDVDYSIEIGNSHQAYIIVYDHKLKKLYLHDVIWMEPEYTLTEEGLEYWSSWNDYNVEGFIPLRKNSKVQVYWTKRT